MKDELLKIPTVSSWYHLLLCKFSVKDIRGLLRTDTVQLGEKQQHIPNFLLYVKGEYKNPQTVSYFMRTQEWSLLLIEKIYAPRHVKDNWCVWNDGKEKRKPTVVQKV